MTWRERQNYFPETDTSRGPQLTLSEGYERAQFKDAPFWVESYTLDSGRRQSVQKFPGDQYTNVQDLGQDSATLSINAFLIGENYDSELLWLEGRLLEGGPGELRLPWREPLWVTVVSRIRTDETKGARGHATVSFDCIETTPPPDTVGADSASRMVEAAEEARTATQERFSDRFDTHGKPESFRARVRTTMNEASVRIVEIQGKVDGFISEISRGANTITRLQGTVNDLINTPLDLSDEIVNAVLTAYSALRSTSATAQNVIETWGKGGPVRILADNTFRFNDEYEPVTITTNTDDDIAEQQNLTEFNRLSRLAMFYEMAELLAELPFESRDQAIALQSEYVEEIDGLLLEATPHEAEAIAKLNEATVSFLDEVAETLPRIGSFTPSVTMPALLASHIIYGDARGEADIVLRNSSVHPGFLEGGVALEVIDA